MTITQVRQFEKDNLTYSYKWSGLENKTALKNKKTLDRSSGEEVLYFINSFFTTQNLSSLMSFKRIESLLYNHLPINIKDKNEINLWLIKNWDKGANQ